MFKKLILLVCAICAISIFFNGCSKDATTADTIAGENDVTIPEMTTPDTTTVETDTTIKRIDWSKSMQYGLLNMHSDDMITHAIGDTIVHSTAELNEYYNQYKSKGGLERMATAGNDSTVGFLNACDKYDDDFFTSHNLLILLDCGVSSDNRYKLANIEKQDNKWNVVINVNQGLSTDLVSWLMLIEVSKDIDAIDDVVIDWQTDYM